MPTVHIASAFLWLVWYYTELCNICALHLPFELKNLFTCLWEKLKVLVSQSLLALWDPVDCSPPGSSVHGILQTRMPEWAAIPFSRGSSLPRGWIPLSCIAGRFFTTWATHLSKAFFCCPTAYSLHVADTAEHTGTKPSWPHEHRFLPARSSSLDSRQQRQAARKKVRGQSPLSWHFVSKVLHLPHIQQRTHRKHQVCLW